jgi:TonB-linked SusC/RagA family outer membrane protein
MRKRLKERKLNDSLRGIIMVIQFILFLGLMCLGTVYAEETLQQKKKLTGTITEENGKPLPGATVMIEGTTIGAISDLNGNFTIESTSENQKLVFSFMGYKTQVVPISGILIVDINMVPDFQAIDEVVVIGYGTQKKVNLSGAVDVVNSKAFENRPVSNAVQALQGLAPNVNVSVGNTGGEMGAKQTLNIRGQGSINGGSPYTLVDGIEQDISNLNPDDIENISVLKDAAAASIYGARAAFGVILVTTKKGRSDGISINYNNNFSFSSPTIVPHSVNSLKFAEYFNTASVNDGKPPLFQKIITDNMQRYQDGEIDYWTVPVPWAPLYWLSYSGSWANTDWYKEQYKTWTPNNTHNVSISGGDERTQFHISGSVFDQAGLLKIGDDSFDRYNLNSKINTKAYDWLRFSLITKYNKTKISRPSYDRSLYYNSVARQWPTNAPYYPDGSLAYENVQIWLEQGGRYNEAQNELTFIPGVEIEPVKDWVIYTNYRWKMNTNPITNHEAKVVGTLADGSKTYLRSTNSYASYMYENYYNSPNIYSTYNKTIGNNSFSIMGGFEQELIQYQSTYSKRYDLVSDDVPSLPTATGKQEASGIIGHWATRSFFGRLNYNFKEKYLMELSMRYDGSSKFPDGYRWGNFPSGSAAWLISRENFWQPLYKYVNMLKLRASYGALGNQNVPPNMYYESMGIYTNLPYIMDGNLPNYVGMPGLISPEITWEKVNTSNIGLDAGFLNNRLNVSFDYFVRNTYDMLGPAESLPAVLGTAVPKRNNATLKTQGFEFVMEWKETINNFSYGAKFMLSDAHSTITDYYNPKNLLVYYNGSQTATDAGSQITNSYNPQNQLSGVFYKGAQLGEIWGYTTTGLFESDEAAQSPDHDQSYLSNEPWRAGDVEYADLNGDGKIDIGKNTLDDPGDRRIIGNSTPRYAYSFVLTSAWKGFDFNMLWQGIAKRDLALDGPLFWGAAGVPDGQWFSVGLEEHMDYWTPENTDAYWPRPYLDKGVKNHQIQSRYIQNGAYLRLKTLQLGYTLPSRITQKAKIQNLRFYVSGENLLTFTKLMTVFDPEATGGSTGSGQIYPLQKLISTGLSITF